MKQIVILIVGVVFLCSLSYAMGNRPSSQQNNASDMTANTEMENYSATVPDASANTVTMNSSVPAAAEETSNPIVNDTTENMTAPDVMIDNTVANSTNEVMNTTTNETMNNEAMNPAG